MRSHPGYYCKSRVSFFLASIISEQQAVGCSFTLKQEMKHNDALIGRILARKMPLIQIQKKK